MATLFSLSACGSGSDENKDSDASVCSTPGTSLPTTACGNPGSTASLCTALPASAVTDVSGTWVMKTVGAQVVKVPGYVDPFQLKSINLSLVHVTQTGSTVSFEGQYCDRSQQDDPRNPGKVLVLDAWRLSPAPFQRTGTFAPDAVGNPTLTMPATVETYGARLTDPACDSLPLDPTDARLVDDDQDGFPGISVGLQGLVTGTLRAVQRQVTALTGYAVTAERIVGGMSYSSDQTVVASDPPSYQCLYRTSNSYSDPTPCSSTFVMVKLDASAGPVDCAWVRTNQAALLGS